MLLLGSRPRNGGDRDRDMASAFRPLGARMANASWLLIWDQIQKRARSNRGRRSAVTIREPS